MELTSETDQDAVRELNRQAVSAFHNHLIGVEDLCQQALQLAAPDGLENPRDLAGAGEALQTLGRLFMARSDYGKALESFHQALSLFEQGNLPREVSLCRSYVAVVFTSLGDYYRAAELLREAHREAEAIPDASLAAEILNDLSYTYVLAGEPEIALTHLQESIQVFRDLGDEMRLSWALESLGQAYLRVGRKEEALACVLEGMNLAIKHQVWRDVARFKQSAGEMYRALGKNDQALAIFQEVLDLARKDGMHGDECIALFSIAEHSQSQQRFREALSLLKEAGTIALKTGSKPNQRQCYQLLSSVYKQLGDYQHALEYHERFYEIDKEIFNSDADQRLRNVQVLYQLETARKEAELYHLRAQSLQLEVEERRRTEVILERMANTDPLTDLLNRRAFFELAEKAFARALHERLPLSLILIDVDHFKKVNDQFGHLVGDQALAQIADRLRNHLRVGDRIARYGGEEFIVLVEGISPTWAVPLADRLRQSVAGEPLQTRGLLVPVTLSLGVAGMETGIPYDSLDQLVVEADQALYAAKNTGRNTVYAYKTA